MTPESWPIDLGKQIPLLGAILWLIWLTYGWLNRQATASEERLAKQSDASEKRILQQSEDCERRLTEVHRTYSERDKQTLEATQRALDRSTQAVDALMRELGRRQGGGGGGGGGG